MFKLEEAISEWRRQMLSAGIKSPAPLDELQSHLYDEIEQQMKSGIKAQQAFENAVTRIGQANVLKGEFNKIKCKAVNRIMPIILGAIGIGVGMGFVLPAVALYRSHSVVSGGHVSLLIFGTALTLSGVGAAASVIFRRYYVTRKLTL